MTNNPMGSLGGYSGDPGDENDSMGGDDLQQCKQDIEDLEQRVSVLEARAGITSPVDEQEANPVAPPMPAMKQMKKPGGAMPFLGVK